MMASCLSPAKEAERESSTLPNWLELPRDVTANILQKVGVVDIWRTIDMSNHCTSSYNLVKICMYAIDRSCGELEDINIEYFGNDELLQYIADRTSCLRSLRLAKSWTDVSDKGLSKVVKKLPLLEYFDISLDYISKDVIEAIGRGSPLLKSLKFFSGLSDYFGGDDEVLAIAKSMSGLRHLKFSYRLTNIGLLAILDGCPLLESLDLRDCINVFFSRSLTTRCYQQIKDFLLPSEYLEYDSDGDSGNDDDSYWVGQSGPDSWKFPEYDSDSGNDYDFRDDDLNYYSD